MQIAHLNVLITGGMSLGDDPTNLMSTIANLDDVGALKAIGFNQEDNFDYKNILFKILWLNGSLSLMSFMVVMWIISIL
jgi:hypothetical protein